MPQIEHRRGTIVPWNVKTAMRRANHMIVPNLREKRLFQRRHSWVSTKLIQDKGRLDVLNAKVVDLLLLFIQIKGP